MNNLSIVIISGLSGAGKSSASKVLEDLGYNTIDNMPLQVVEKIVEIFYALDNPSSKIAFVIDSRSKDSALAYDTILMLKNKYGATLLFMDASLDTLVKRYKETRRKHPQGDDLVEAIKKEIALMDDIKDSADIVFNSDNKNVHELASEIQSYFSGSERTPITIIIQSFGFKYGLPSEADLVFDVRFLKNPHFVDGLKEHTGLEECVKNYVKSDENYDKFIEKLQDMVLFLVPQYIKEGKKYLNIAIGCTGGRHRSVTVVQDLADILQGNNQKFVRLKHRDIKKTT